MSNVTGPTSNLPGALRAPPAGTPCDQHPDRIAMHRVTGEVDSFGSEENDMCQECYIEYLASVTQSKKELVECDICHNDGLDRSPARDPEEGTMGPIYIACPECREILRSSGN